MRLDNKSLALFDQTGCFQRRGVNTIRNVYAHNVQNRQHEHFSGTKEKKNQYFSLIPEEGTNKIQTMPLNGCLLAFFMAMYVQRGTSQMFIYAWH